MPTSKKQKEISEEREKVMKIHGVWHRFNNIKIMIIQEQIQMCCCSKTFNPMYNQQLANLESAACFCSIGASEWESAGVCTFLNGRKINIEYFILQQNSNAKQASQTARELKALSTALTHWGPDSFEKETVCFITDNDELYAMLEFGSNRPKNNTDRDRNNRKANEELIESIGDIKAQLRKQRIDWSIFCVPKPSNDLARLAAASVEDDAAGDKFNELIEKHLSDFRLDKVNVKSKGDRKNGSRARSEPRRRRRNRSEDEESNEEEEESGTDRRTNQRRRQSRVRLSPRESDEERSEGEANDKPTRTGGRKKHNWDSDA